MENCLLLSRNSGGQLNSYGSNLLVHIKMCNLYLRVISPIWYTRLWSDISSNVSRLRWTFITLDLILVWFIKIEHIKEADFIWTESKSSNFSPELSTKSERRYSSRKRLGNISISGYGNKNFFRVRAVFYRFQYFLSIVLYRFKFAFMISSNQILSWQMWILRFTILSKLNFKSICRMSKKVV